MNVSVGYIPESGSCIGCPDKYMITCVMQPSILYEIDRHNQTYVPITGITNKLDVMINELRTLNGFLSTGVIKIKVSPP